MKKKLSVPMTAREVSLGTFYLLFQLLLLPGLLLALWDRFFPGGSDDSLNFTFYMLNFLAVVGIFHTFLKKSLIAAGKGIRRLLGAVVGGFLVYYAGSLLLSRLILLLRPGFANVNDDAIAAMAGSGLWKLGVGTILLVPPVEECFYRGLIFRGLHKKSRAWAYLLSTLAFCAIHVAGYVGTVDGLTLALCFVQYIPAGLCLAWAYETADTIFAPILIHAAINAVGIWGLR